MRFRRGRWGTLGLSLLVWAAASCGNADEATRTEPLVANGTPPFTATVAQTGGIFRNQVQLFLRYEKEVAAALGLPANVQCYALLPIGYPMGRFGPVRRVPLDEVVYGDRWGQPYRDL